jgi:hypothetical protein
VVIAQTLAREALAAERARRAAWQRTVENAASFGALNSAATSDVAAKADMVPLGGQVSV